MSKRWFYDAATGRNRGDGWPVWLRVLVLIGVAMFCGLAFYTIQMG